MEGKSLSEQTNFNIILIIHEGHFLTDTDIQQFKKAERRYRFPLNEDSVGKLCLRNLFKTLVFLFFSLLSSSFLP